MLSLSERGLIFLWHRPWFRALALLVASAVPLALYLSAGARHAGGFGFPLDDSS
jgi:hypothetical protein